MEFRASYCHPNGLLKITGASLRWPSCSERKGGQGSDRSVLFSFLQALFRSGRANYELHNLDEAERVLEQLTDQDPTLTKAQVSQIVAPSLVSFDLLIEGFS